MKNTPTHRNLKVRAGKYYWRETIKGQKYFESLHVPATGRKTEEKEAIARMDEKRRLARSENFSSLEKTRTKVGYATIGAVFEQYKLAARARRLDKNTVKKNINSLKMILRTAGESDSDTTSTLKLTDNLARHYRDSMIASRPADRESQDTVGRTIRSTLTQARSIFADWTSGEYKNLKLPDLTGFKKGGAIRTYDKLYVYPPTDLVKKTIRQGRKLLKKRKDLYSIFLLAYDAGLRASEIKEAQRDWIQDNHIEVRAGKTVTTRRVIRKIPLNPKTIEELKSCLRKDEQYILPGPHKTARSNLVDYDFAGWMRSIGWDAATYNHTTHELRALFGSKVYTERGANVASKLLGHKSVVTTCKFYADLDKRPDALERE